MNPDLNIRIRSTNEESERCPACNEALLDEPLVACSSNHVRLHLACFNEGLVSNCPLTGCRSPLYPLKRSQLQSSMERKNQGLICPGCQEPIRQGERVASCRRQHLWAHQSCALRRLVRYCTAPACGEPLTEQKMPPSLRAELSRQAEEPKDPAARRESSDSVARRYPQRAVSNEAIRSEATRGNLGLPTKLLVLAFFAFSVGALAFMTNSLPSLYTESDPQIRKQALLEALFKGDQGDVNLALKNLELVSDLDESILEGLRDVVEKRSLPYARRALSILAKNRPRDLNLWAQLVNRATHPELGKSSLQMLCAALALSESRAAPFFVNFERSSKPLRESTTEALYEVLPIQSVASLLPILERLSELNAGELDRAIQIVAGRASVAATRDEALSLIRALRQTLTQGSDKHFASLEAYLLATLRAQPRARFEILELARAAPPRREAQLRGLISSALPRLSHPDSQSIREELYEVDPAERRLIFEEIFAGRPDLSFAQLLVVAEGCSKDLLPALARHMGSKFSLQDKSVFSKAITGLNFSLQTSLYRCFLDALPDQNALCGFLLLIGSEPALPLAIQTVHRAGIADPSFLIEALVDDDLRFALGARRYIEAFLEQDESSLIADLMLASTKDEAHLKAIQELLKRPAQSESGARNIADALMALPRVKGRGLRPEELGRLISPFEEALNTFASQALSGPRRVAALEILSCNEEGVLRLEREFATGLSLDAQRVIAFGPCKGPYAERLRTLAGKARQNLGIPEQRRR